MTNSPQKTVDDLYEEMQFLKAKLNLLEQKKMLLMEAEDSLRTDMQRVENQIHRLRQLEKTAE